MALFAGLRSPEALAGIACLSGYLTLSETLPKEVSEANRQVPVFQAHGTQDALVAYDVGRGDRDRLTAAGYLVEWHEYPMAHEVCRQELLEIGRWLERVLER